jgi:hypothetical protein
VDEAVTRPSAAPVAGGATTPSSRFGGATLEAHLFRFLARLGRRVTALAYRRLRDLEKRRAHSTERDDRAGPAGSPSRTAGAPPPHRP